MKKIYAMLALGAAMTASVSAAEFKGKAQVNNFEGWELVKMSDVVAPEYVQNVPMKAAKKKASTRANASLEGLYYQQWYSMKNNAYTYGGFQIVADAADPTKGVMLGLSQYADVTPTVTIDNANGTFSVIPASYGEGGQWTNPDTGLTYNTTIELVHGLWNENGIGFKMVDEPLVYKVDEDGYFMNANGGRDMFMIIAHPIDYPDEGTYLTFNSDNRGYNIQGFKYPETLDNEGWIDLGEAEITNNGFIGSVEPYSVAVQKSSEEDGVYRLLNPFSGFYGNEIGGYEGELRFDVSTPTCPLIMFGPSIYSGAAYYEVVPDYGWTETNPFVYTMAFTTYVSDFYYSQDFSPEAEDVPFTPAEIAEEFGEEECGSVDGDVITFAGLQGSISIGMQLYKWQDDPDMYADKFIIKMPANWDAGVNEIIANENAPVKYYNLQGMEIKTPEAGQLVIKKQGGKTSKYFAK